MNGKPWTPEEDDTLRRLYGSMKAAELAKVMKRPKGSLICRANRLGLYTRAWYTPEQMAMLVAEYPNRPNSEIAKLLGRTTRSVEQTAVRLKLKKDPAYLAAQYRAQAERLAVTGKAHRFQPQQTPWNKGVTGWCAEGCKATQFKPGNRPWRWHPVGTERINADGYIEVKFADVPGPNSLRWRCKHLLLWESVHGPMPEHHAVVFINGDKRDIRLDNLELITRAELLARNSWLTKYPPDLRAVIQLRGVLNRIINKKKRGNHEESTSRSA